MNPPAQRASSETAREAAIKARAVRYLSLAFQEGREALSCDWVKRDPDLAAVRDDEDQDWRLVMQRYCSSNAAQLRKPKWSEIAGVTTTLAQETSAIRGYPEPPWGDPRSRLQRWLVVAAVGVLVAFVAFGVTGSLSTSSSVALGSATAGLGAALATVRRPAIRERQRTRLDQDSLQSEPEGEDTEPPRS